MEIIRSVTTPTIQKPPRMQWIDAMRGFTMLMVVAYHVSLISFGETPKTSAAMSLLVLFRMPLFFFVSGFVAYKATFSWSISDTAHLLWKKIQIQIVPTAVFLCAYLVIRRSDFTSSLTEAIQSPYKFGYWFTLTLLYMFVCYYAISMLIRKMPHQNLIWTAIWVASIGLYATAYMPRYFTYPQATFMKTTSLIQLIIYFHFFLAGNLAHRYWRRLQQLFDSKWFFPLLCLIAFASCADILRWHTMRMMWTNLPRTLAMYTTMTIVLMFFRHYEQSFTKQTHLGRTLQYIGTRTLDVYLLHYIFLPVMPFMGEWFNHNRPNFVLSIVSSVSIAAAVIFFCLVTSNLLRISPLYSEHLFGRREPSSPPQPEQQSSQPQP